MKPQGCRFYYALPATDQIAQRPFHRSATASVCIMSFEFCILIHVKVDLAYSGDVDKMVQNAYWEALVIYTSVYFLSKGESTLCLKFLLLFILSGSKWYLENIWSAINHFPFLHCFFLKQSIFSLVSLF